MKYYRVTAKCGHVGNGMYCVKNFYVRADSKKTARTIVRKKPRVKKSLANAIMDIHRISYEAFLDGKDEFHNDPYFKFRSNADALKAKQKGYKEKKYKKSGVFDGKIRVRNPKKYYRYKI